MISFGRLPVAALLLLSAGQAAAQSAAATGSSCQSVVDADGTPIHTAGPLGGATDECEAGWCLSMELLFGTEAPCGSIGSKGNGCTTDDDCYSDGSTYPPFTFVCTAAKQCAIPTGQPCHNVKNDDGDSPGTLSSVGGATEACATGWCLNAALVEDMSYCGSIGSKGDGCTTDDDCYQGENGFNLVCTADKQCKIPTGYPCYALTIDPDQAGDIYRMSSLGGATEFCTTGWCLSELSGAPVCGSIGSKGLGCTTDSDCDVTGYDMTSLQLICSSGQCKMIEGSECPGDLAGATDVCATGYCGGDDSSGFSCLPNPNPNPNPSTPPDSSAPCSSCASAVFQSYKQWKEEVKAAGACPQPAIGGTDDQGRKTCRTRVDGRAWYMVLD